VASTPGRRGSSSPSLADSCKLQTQLRQLAVEAIQPRNEPARQQAARAGQHEGRIFALPAQVGTGTAQTLEGIEGRIAQAQAGIGEFYATPLLDEQGQAKLFLQRTYLPAHGAMGYAQLLRSLADTLQAGSGLEGAQGIQRGQFSAHAIGEFS